MAYRGAVDGGLPVSPVLPENRRRCFALGEVAGGMESDWVPDGLDIDRPSIARIYDYLFSVDRPMDVEAGKSFTDNLNPDSLEVINPAWAEPSLAEAKGGDRFQFERLGYFVRDAGITDAGSGLDGKQVFNKTVGLRDTWAKIINQKAKHG